MHMYMHVKTITNELLNFVAQYLCLAIYIILWLLNTFSFYVLMSETIKILIAANDLSGH